MFLLYELHDSYVIVHALRPFKLSHQPLKLIDLHEMELDLIVLLSLVHALSFFNLSSIFGIFRMLGIVFGLVVWVGMLLRELNIRAFRKHCPIVY